MCQLDWWKHKHGQMLLGKRSEMWLFNYCSVIIAVFLLDTAHIIICIWAQTCLGIKVDVSAHTWLWPHDYSMSGHKRVWAQTCVGTDVRGHKHVWAQTCVGTDVRGHKRVKCHKHICYALREFTWIRWCYWLSYEQKRFDKVESQFWCFSLYFNME